MHMSEHLRSAHRAALTFGVGLAIAATALGAGLASRLSHESAILAPSCAAPPAAVEGVRERPRACAGAARFG